MPWGWWCFTHLACSEGATQKMCLVATWSKQEDAAEHGELLPCPSPLWCFLHCVLSPHYSAHQAGAPLGSLPWVQVQQHWSPGSTTWGKQDHSSSKRMCEKINFVNRGLVCIKKTLFPSQPAANHPCYDRVPTGREAEDKIIDLTRVFSSENTDAGAASPGKPE